MMHLKKFFKLRLQPADSAINQVAERTRNRSEKSLNRSVPETVHQMVVSMNPLLNLLFALLTFNIVQFREDFHFVVVHVEIFGGEPLAAPWAFPATPLQASRAADTPIRRSAGHCVICGCGFAALRYSAPRIAGLRLAASL
jgi:hypothetical protein